MSQHFTGKQEEFKALIRRAGWRPAEAARRLGISKSIVSRYVNGSADPPQMTLHLLARLVKEATPPAEERTASIDLREAAAGFDYLRVLADLDSAKAAIDRAQESIKRAFHSGRPPGGVYYPAVKYAKPNSELDAVEKAFLDEEAALAKNAPQSPKPKPGAGGHSAQTYRPKRGAGPGSKSQNAPGAETPSEPNSEEDSKH